MTLIVVQSLFQLLIPVNLLSINMEANRHEINLFYTDLIIREEHKNINKIVINLNYKIKVLLA